MIHGGRVLRTCPESHESKLENSDKIKEEERERGSWIYSHESDALSPGIRLDCGVLGEAFRSKGLVGRGEEVNEGRGYDDAGAKVLCDEEGRFGHPHSFGPSKRNGDDGAQETADENDKDGANAQA